MQQPIRIALADDHTLFRKGMAELIRSFDNFDVVLDVRDGQALLDALQASTVLPDICVLDINMPVLNGYETVLALKEKWPDIRVLAVSMHDSEFSIIKMLRNGANGYLVKDSDPADLRLALTTIYEKGFYHSELMSSRIVGQLQHNAQEILTIINISESEINFLKWISSDLSIKEIADKMGVKPRTLEKHSEVLSRKLNIKSRTGLALFAMRIGIVSLNEFDNA